VKIFLPFLIGTLLGWHEAGLAQPFADWKAATDHTAISLPRAELILHEHMLQIYKIADKGYASSYLLDKGIKETRGRPEYMLYHEWLTDLRRFPGLAPSELMVACRSLKEGLSRQSGLPYLFTTQRLNSCRQIFLQQLAPRVLADGQTTSDELAFLGHFMSAYVYGRNQADFIWFMQRLAARPEAAAAVSRVVTEHVVKRNKQIPKDLLMVLAITPELTHHVQTFGLDADSTRQIFQQEYSRLIEQAYGLIDKKAKADAERLARSIGTWLKHNAHRLDAAAAWGRYGDLGKNLWRNGMPQVAVEVFDQIIANGLTDLREDAQQSRLWVWLAVGEWREARKWIERERLPSQFDTINESRLKFWIATTYHQTGAGPEARKLWEKVVQQHPLSFYAIMAHKALKAHHPSSPVVSYYSAAAHVSPPAFGAATWGDSYHGLRRLRAWARLDAKAFMRAEARMWRKQTAPGLADKLPTPERAVVQADLQLLPAILVGQEKNFLESFRMIYEGLDRKQLRFSRALLETLYPRPYFEQLSKALVKHDFDPLVVLSLIRQESVFNPEARSRVGARGLMQLMPTTARRIRRGVGDSQLTTPATNIEIGTRYFQTLHRRYRGNLVYILAAYNAGEARVERWRGTYLMSEDMLTNIENIPFLETRNYVKLIFRNLFFYKTLEPPATPSLADDGSFNRVYNVELGFKR